MHGSYFCSEGSIRKFSITKSTIITELEEITRQHLPEKASLEALCFSKLIHLHDQQWADNTISRFFKHLEGLGIPKALALPRTTNPAFQERLRKFQRYNNAVHLFSIFGKEYPPEQIKLSLPEVHLSHDKRYFFQYDSTTTMVCLVGNSNFEPLMTLEGRFEGISIDSKWLMLKKGDESNFYSMPSFELIHSIKGQYDKAKDLVVFNPDGEKVIVPDCLLQDVPDWLLDKIHGPKRLYTVGLNRFQGISDKAYIFAVHGVAVQLEYLKKGERFSENDSMVLFNDNGENLIFPVDFVCDQNGGIELILRNYKGCIIEGEEHRNLVDFMCKSQATEEYKSVNKFITAECAYSIALARDAGKVLIGSLNNTIVKDLNAPHSMKVVQGFFRPDSMVVSANGRYCLSTRNGEWLGPEYLQERNIIQEFNLLDLDKVISITLLKDQAGSIRSFGFFADCKHFFVICGDSMYLYSLEDQIPTIHDNYFLDYDLMNTICWFAEIVSLLTHLELRNQATIDDFKRIDLVKTYFKMLEQSRRQSMERDQGIVEYFNDYIDLAWVYFKMLDDSNTNKEYLKHRDGNIVLCGQLYEQKIKEYMSNSTCFLEMLTAAVNLVKDPKLKQFLIGYFNMQCSRSFLDKLKQITE